MYVNNLPKVATQWNSGATRESDPGPRVRIPSSLTTDDNAAAIQLRNDAGLFRACV